MVGRQSRSRWLTAVACATLLFPLSAGTGRSTRTMVAPEVSVDPSPRPLARVELAAAQLWETSGEAMVRRVPGPPETDLLEIRGSSGASAKMTFLRQPPFAGAGRARLRVQAPGARADRPVVFDVGFYDEGAGNRWWRRVRIEEGGWQTLELELPYLRYARGRVPRWEDVQRLGIRLRSEATLHLETLELWGGEAGSSPYLGVEHLRDAFSEPDGVREAKAGPFVVLTDAPELDLEAVAAALLRMHEQTRARFPALAEPERRVPLLVFRTDAGYRAFWERLGERLGSAARPLPEDQGYTWQGIATASFSDAYGPVRPVYVHEASHALLERALGLDAQRSWIFEGLGILDQLAVSGQDLAPVFVQGLVRSDVKMPVEEMIAGKPIPTDRYWQAAMLVEYLLADPARHAALEAVLLDMRAQGSADLRPLLVRHLGVDAEQFSAAFWRWAWQRYAHSPGT